MRIALVHTPLWGRGGAERQILTLAVELQKLGNEVELFTPFVNENTCYPELLNKLKINTIPENRFVPLRQRNAMPLSSTSSTGEIINSGNRFRRIAVHQFYTLGLPSMLSLGKTIPKGFDVINNHNAPTEWAAFVAKKRLKIPVIWMCNEPPSWFYFAQDKGIKKTLTWPLFELWDKMTIRYIDEITVLSHVAEGLVRNVYNTTSRLVRTGVDAEKFYKKSGSEIRKKLNLENDFVLLQTANLAPAKRQIDSIKALYILSKKYNNVKLILDGSGPQEELKRFTEKLGLKEKVIFWHSKCDEELAEFYAACDIFVFPAPITWGLAVIEAMASAKPAVVSMKCGASEIIQNGVNGMTFENANPKKMAEKIEVLINDSRLRTDIGKRAKEYVKANLTWRNYAKSMERTFREVLNKTHN